MFLISTILISVALVYQIVDLARQRRKINLDKQIKDVVIPIVLVTLAIVFQFVGIIIAIVQTSQNMLHFITIAFCLVWLVIKVLHLNVLVETKGCSKE